MTNAEKATANLTIVSKNPELLRKSWWVVYFIKKKATQYNPEANWRRYCLLFHKKHAARTTIKTGLQTILYRLPVVQLNIYHNNYEFKLNRE